MKFFRGFFLIGTFIFWGLVLWGCPAPVIPVPDASEEQTVPDIRCYAYAPGRPKITQIDYDGQIDLQPHTLRFRVQWSDDNGDLSGGFYEFFWGHTSLGQRAFPESMSGVSEGTVMLVVDLPKESYPPGRELLLELWLVDSKGQRSNRVRVGLEAFR